MKDYKHAVFVGRFQPLHNGHLQVIQKGLEIAEQVIIVIGSASAAPSPKNPFTFEQRRDMIEASIPRSKPRELISSDIGRLKIIPVRDYYYNESAWVMDIQAKIDAYITPGEQVALIGQFRDASSYYLKLFPQWDHIPIETDHLNATAIRTRLLREVPMLPDWQGKVPEGEARDRSHDLVANMPVPDGVKDMLDEWVETKEFMDLAKEHMYIETYKASWSKAPFVPTFNTVDACVTTSGHVLVVQRKTNPGKGLYALPGGFLKPTEFTRDGMIRELKEETGIRLEKPMLVNAIVNDRVFDHPDRSLRGRTISHGFHIKLRDGSLPEVKGNDDASRAFWMPLWDVIKYEDRFFEDHAHIITYFTNVGAQGER